MIKKFIAICVFLMLYFGGLFTCFAQLDTSLTNKNAKVNEEPDTIQQDLGDFVRSLTKAELDTSKKDKFISFMLLPSLGSSPATGFTFGVSAQLSFTGLLPFIRLSMISAKALVTTKNQFLFYAKHNVFLHQNKILLTGDFKYYIFSQTTYGLGTNAPGNGIKNHYDVNGWETTDDSLSQPMTYNYLKFHETVSFEVANNIYIGGGVHYDSYDKINDLKLDTSNNRLTSHYGYNNYNGYSTTKYGVLGFSLNTVYDSRDNQLNPYKGFYANLNFKAYPIYDAQAKTNLATTTAAEFRYYLPLSKEVKRHLIGFWLMADYLTSGTLPYMVLPALGYDQRERAGRGYSQGRFRGESFVYGETEYRFPISRKTRILGGVVFANVSTASNRNYDVKLFDYLKPACGAGLRIMVDKKSRMNLMVDYGIGYKTQCFYFGMAETF